MTSFAFILGCVPLWIAPRLRRGGAPDPGHGGDHRHAGGDAASPIFLIPLLFVLVERLALTLGGTAQHDAGAGAGGECVMRCADTC